MAGPSVQTTASRSNRSLAASAERPAERKKLSPNPVLLFWRHMIKSAVADAKRTAFGLPTDGAILARIWIEEHKPKQENREEWERSFECACVWLELDVDAERKRLVAEIEASWQEQALHLLRCNVYVRRASVLTCAQTMVFEGEPVAIGRQFVLPLVSAGDYETVAGVEHGDPRNAFDHFVGLQAA